MSNGHQIDSALVFFGNRSTLQTMQTTQQTDLRRRGHRRGFTLVEILVVVAVMAILLAVAGSMIGGSDVSTTVRTASRDLQMMVDAAQIRAQSRGIETAVLIANHMDPGGDAALQDSHLRLVVLVERADTNNDGISDTWQAVGNPMRLDSGAYYFLQHSHSETFDPDGSAFTPFPPASPLVSFNDASRWIGLVFNPQGQPILGGGAASGNPVMVVGTGEPTASGLDATEGQQYLSHGFMILRSNGRTVPMESAYDQVVSR